MPYNPTYDRGSKGRFDPDKSFIGVRAGSDAYLMEDEVNEMQANLLHMTRAQMRTLFRSGPLDTIGAVNLTADLLSFDKFTALVDGLIVTVGCAGNSSTTDEKNYVRLGAKPTTGSRTDLVFLEVYEMEVKHGSTLYKYGTIGGKTLPNDLLDQRVGAETARRLQLVGELRVVEGSAVPDKDGQNGAVYTPYDNLGLYKSSNGRLAIKLFSFQRASNESAIPQPTVAYTKATMIAPDPMSANAVVPKSYVDGIKWRSDAKESVRVATTANISLTGTQTIDGVTVAVGDRVLVKNQSAQAANGIYVVQSAGWTRAEDAVDASQLTAGVYCWVMEGGQQYSCWLLTNSAVTVGSTALTFVQVSGLAQVTANNGLTKTGNTIGISALGVTNGMIAANAITYDKLGAGSVTSAALGTGAVTSAALGAGVVTSAALGVGAVTSAALGAGAVTSAALGAGAVTSAALGTGAVTSDKLGANAVVNHLGYTPISENVTGLTFGNKMRLVYNATTDSLDIVVI